MRLILDGKINKLYIQSLCMAFFRGEKFPEDEENPRGDSFNYGFIVGAVPTTEHDQIIDAEGNSLLENTVTASFTDIAFENLTIYNLKMVGISNDQVTTAIYCCAYVIDGESISYMGDSVTTKAVAVSSDSIIIIEATTPPAAGEEENA